MGSVNWQSLQQILSLILVLYLYWTTQPLLTSKRKNAFLWNWLGLMFDWKVILCISLKHYFQDFPVFQFNSKIVFWSQREIKCCYDSRFVCFLFVFLGPFIFNIFFQTFLSKPQYRVLHLYDQNSLLKCLLCTLWPR